MSQQKIFTSSFGCLRKESGWAAVWSPWKHFFFSSFFQVSWQHETDAPCNIWKADFGSVDRISNWPAGALVFQSAQVFKASLSGTQQIYTQAPFIQPAEAQRCWVHFKVNWATLVDPVRSYWSKVTRRNMFFLREPWNTHREIREKTYSDSECWSPHWTF